MTREIKQHCIYCRETTQFIQNEDKTLTCTKCLMLDDPDLIPEPEPDEEYQLSREEFFGDFIMF
jgi:hypothetical protein